MADSTSAFGLVNIEELKAALVGSGGLGLLAAGGIAFLTSIAAHADSIFTNTTIAGLATFGISYVLTTFKKANQGPAK